MSQRDGGVNRQRSVETGLTQAIRPMLICASESSVSVRNQQGSDQLPVPQTSESRMAKMKKKISSPLVKRRNLSGGVVVMTNKTFGVSIDELLKRSEGCEVPPIITSIVEYLAKHGMSHEGIFRISGNHKVVESLKATYDKDGVANLEQVGDVMAVAGLLKLFLRELPEPPIPQSMTTDFIKIYQAHKDDRGGLSEIKALLEKLPASHYILLKYLCDFLVKVSMNEENNKMSSMALAIVFGPNFFRCGDGIEGLREQGHTNAVVCKFLEDFDALFEVSPYATTDIFRVQEAKTNDSPTLLARNKLLQKVVNEKNESSASDEDSFHLIGEKDQKKVQDDGPIYATVKKPKKTLQPSTHILSPTEDLDMYVRSVSPSWNTQQSDSGPTLESTKPPAGKEIVQKVINDTIKEHLFGPDLTSTDENSPHSPESGDEGPPLPSRNYSDEDKPRRRRRRNVKNHKETSDSSSLVENNKPEHISVKSAVEELETSNETEEQNLVKPLKKRPKSEGFELFEKTGIVIGVDKNSNNILSSTYPQKRDSRDQGEFFKDDEDLYEEILPSTSKVDALSKVDRNSELLGSLTRDRAPPPKNRRRPSLKKRHDTSEVFTNDDEESDKGVQQIQSKSLVHPLVDEAKNKNVVSTTPPRSPRTVKSSRIQPPSALPRQEPGEVDEVDSSPFRPRKDLITKQYKKKHHGAPIVPPLELYKLQQHDPDGIQLSPRERYDGFGTDEALLSPRSRPLTIDTRTIAHECPPSPPHEQIEHSWFDRRVESSPKSEQTVKQLAKTISQLKKKIRDFEDAFEDEHARRPSQSEKAPIKKYVSELGRARKQLKELKERAKGEAERLNETVPPMSGQGMRSSNSEPLLTTTPTSIEHSLESLLKKLEEKRDEAGRPEEVDQMEREQLQDEKLAVQKALLQHESLFGRPNTKKDKDLMRPLYDRYRTIKRKLATPATESPMKIPGGTRPRTSSIDRLVSDLAPIHEDALLHSPSGGSPARNLTQSLPITGGRCCHAASHNLAGDPSSSYQVKECTSVNEKCRKLTFN
ncbi:Protein fam13a [Desmophyllum pertusum]|uniref:Protein fam13a n=1 Tax=Desmophyllum pertusum TaxID=174260 RepID=A0A9W9ZJF4_9CNID|nr:Protein fam13a [Desmophyllum pertusum]